MGTLRAAYRLPAIALVTGSAYFLWLVTRLFIPLAPGAARATHFWVVRNWSRALCWVLRIRIEANGTPPESPFLLVSNHLSYIDIIVFFTRVDCFFLAKSEVAKWPILGFLARTSGTLFVDRTRKSDLVRVLSHIEDVHTRGSGVMFFPEGTSTKGEVVEHFKPSLFEVAAKTGIQVSVAAITYRTPPAAEPAHMSVCWWGDMPFAGHIIDLMQLPSIDARIDFSDERFTDSDRKELAASAQSAVEELFIPVVSANA